MKIELEGSLLKMIPENNREKEELNQLWAVSTVLRIIKNWCQRANSSRVFMRLQPSISSRFLYQS